MIRLATINDLPSIVSIYNEAVATGHATADLSPISVDSRREWFSAHQPFECPIYVWDDGGVKGWCSLSHYRPGRKALRYTRELSYYVGKRSHRQGIATRLIQHALAECKTLTVKNVFAIVLEVNTASSKLLEKLNFERWGFLPRVADFDGTECGHVYYGLRISS